MSDSAKENSLEFAELLDAVCRHHLPGIEISFAAPIEWVPFTGKSIAAASRLKHANAFGHNLFPDTIARYDRDLIAAFTTHYAIFLDEATRST
jgi:hypothetical protein